MKAHQSEFLLFTAATIWGFAFVAQRAGMEHVGPFTFNGIRFALGCLALVPLLIVRARRARGTIIEGRMSRRGTLAWGSITGIVLFTGASLQQTGIVSTTAGKAGFITGLYVVIVPILGLFWKRRTGWGTWMGAVIATAGLYLLSASGQVSISRGDFLVLASAFFWAGHVLLIGTLSARMDVVKLAFMQFAACSILSLAAALAMEQFIARNIMAAAVPIIYGGALSVGVAYTLQAVAQQYAPPAHAAVILSLETVFAAFGGWLLLSESIPPRGLAGCALMLAGIILSQRSFHAGLRANRTGSF